MRLRTTACGLTVVVIVSHTVIIALCDGRAGNERQREWRRTADRRHQAGGLTVHGMLAIGVADGENLFPLHGPRSVSLVCKHADAGRVGGVGRDGEGKGNDGGNLHVCGDDGERVGWRRVRREVDRERFL